MTQVTQTAGTGASVVDKRVDFSYTDAGLLATIDRYEDLTGMDLVASTTYTYDDQLRLTDLVHAKGATTLADYSWEFDADGRITQFDSSQDGVVDYTYDDRGQLTVADYDYQTDESYTYDANGNRTNTGYHNLVTSDGTYNYEYDDENNRTKRTTIATGDYVEYTWDNRNRLTSVTFYDSSDVKQKEVFYEYDVYNRRIKKEVDDTGNGTVDRTELFVCDEAGKVDSNGIGHLDDIVLVFEDSDGPSGSGPLTLSSRLLHGPAIDQVLADEQFVNGLFDETQWLLADNLGTIRDTAVYDDGTDTTTIDNHLTLDAFGNITSETNTSETPRYTFTGREWDADAELYYYRARWYDATLGRFVSDDPTGFAGGDANEQRYVLSLKTSAEIHASRRRGNRVRSTISSNLILTSFCGSASATDSGVPASSTATHCFVERTWKPSSTAKSVEINNSAFSKALGLSC